jgi:hypothetical protein
MHPICVREHSRPFALGPASANVHVLLGEEAMAVSFNPTILGRSEAAELFLLRQGPSTSPILSSRFLPGALLAGPLRFALALGLVDVNAVAHAVPSECSSFRVPGA